jgi:dTDP-L-rhamnose 4-epimerase
MSSKILVTGGAGFIGSHLADELLAHGYGVRALDNLCPQVHGKNARRPAYLDARVELVIGDVRDPATVRSALTGADAVVHLAASVGVGQSMYRIQDYTSVNNLGTAVLLEELAKNPTGRLIVTSSMSIYGEGRYCADDGAIHDRVERSLEQLRAGRWEPALPDGKPLRPLPTPEQKTPNLASVYALSKYDQERLCLMIGRAYGIPTVALRLFNTYGPRQALGNPYTGVLANFAARLLNDKPAMIFEDGEQRRDFVSVRDVARACRLALEANAAVDHAINIGSGQPISVLEAAERIAQALGKKKLKPEVTLRYRMGDIRHCFADISLARELLGYRPLVSLEDGLCELGSWLVDQEPVDRLDTARGELESRGLSL